jgi:HPt (histidine-containing phosphotransfer) domain-containing protein
MPADAAVDQPGALAAPRIKSGTVIGLIDLYGPDRDDLKMLVNRFESDSGSRLAGMRTAAAAGDLATLDNLGHKLGGSAAMMGAERVSKLSRVLQDSARCDDREQVGSTIRLLGQELPHALMALRARTS